MYLYVDVIKGRSVFFIVDHEKEIIRSTVCLNCTIPKLCRMTRNIVGTYPEINKIVAEMSPLGAEYVRTMIEEKWVNVDIKGYEVRTL